MEKNAESNKRLNMNSLISKFLNSSEIDEFALWAFGNDYKELQGISFIEKWNELHEEYLKLFPGGLVYEDTRKMVDLWKEK